MDFGEFDYTNVGQHKKINAWWRCASYVHSDINLFFMRSIALDGYGELKVGFIQDQTNYHSLIINTLTITDKSDQPVQMKQFHTPLTNSFSVETFPLFDGGCSNGRDVLRDYAEVLVEPAITTKSSPYNIYINGWYEYSDGAKELFEATVPMTVKRKRSVEPIVNFWP